MAFVAQTYSFGEVLASSKMNQMDTNIDEVRAQHKGSSAPASLAAGVLWLDDTNSNAWDWGIYDGAAFIDFARVRDTDNVIDFFASALHLNSTSLLTLSSGAATGIKSRHTIAAESGTSDDLDTLTDTNYVDGSLVLLKADAGDTIYITTAGNFAQPCMLDDSSWIPFLYDGTNFNLLNQGWILLDRLTASDSSSLDFVKGIESAYTHYLLVGRGVIPATVNSSINLRVDSNAGASFETTGYVGHIAETDTADASTVSANITAEIPLCRAVGSTGSESANFSARIYDPASGAFNTNVECLGVGNNNVAGTERWRSFGAWATVTAVNALQVKASADNLEAGTVSLYGLKI